MTTQLTTTEGKRSVARLSESARRYVQKSRADNTVRTYRAALREFAAYAGSLPASVQYLRVHAENVGQCPDWHGDAGDPAWLFVDEILVNGDRVPR